MKMRIKSSGDCVYLYGLEENFNKGVKAGQVASELRNRFDDALYKVNRGKARITAVVSSKSSFRAVDFVEEVLVLLTKKWPKAEVVIQKIDGTVVSVLKEESEGKTADGMIPSERERNSLASANEAYKRLINLKNDPSRFQKMEFWASEYGARLANGIIIADMSIEEWAYLVNLGEDFCQKVRSLQDNGVLYRSEEMERVIANLPDQAVARCLRERYGFSSGVYPGDKVSFLASLTLQQQAMIHPKLTRALAVFGFIPKPDKLSLSRERGAQIMSMLPRFPITTREGLFTWILERNLPSGIDYVDLFTIKESRLIIKNAELFMSSFVSKKWACENSFSRAKMTRAKKALQYLFLDCMSKMNKVEQKQALENMFTSVRLERGDEFSNQDRRRIKLFLEKGWGIDKSQVTFS